MFSSPKSLINWPNTRTYGQKSDGKAQYDWQGNSQILTHQPPPPLRPPKTSLFWKWHFRVKKRVLGRFWVETCYFRSLLFWNDLFWSFLAFSSHFRRFSWHFEQPLRWARFSTVTITINTGNSGAWRIFWKTDRVNLIKSKRKKTGKSAEKQEIVSQNDVVRNPQEPMFSMK